MPAMAHVRSRETTAPPEHVWKLWSDPSTWPDWNPDVLSINLEGPFAAGTPGQMRTRAGGAHRIRLDSVEPGRAFQLTAAALPLSPLSFRCEIAPSGSGSRISQGVTINGPLAFVLSPLMGEKIADSFGPLLDGLARRAEAGHA
jgi:polyketide cyclase/dehydrase/lipid transport protein